MHFVALPENQENTSKILIFRHEFKFLQIVCRNNTKCRQTDYKMSPCQNALDFSMLQMTSIAARRERAGEPGGGGIKSRTGQRRRGAP